MRGLFIFCLICIGFCFGVVLSQVLWTMQPKNVTHNVNLTIEKPIEARLQIEAVDNCIVKGSC